MRWRVYTKVLISEATVCVPWYWCKETPEGNEESAEGFLSRSECEADAVKHGCRLEDQAEERRTPISRLLAQAISGR